MSRGTVILVALVWIAAFVAGHLAVVSAYPVVIMDAAMKRLTSTGAAVNAWGHGKPADGTSRKIVRPSPDLANSRCVFDLSTGPIRIRAAPGDDYVSVSLYAANSDNFFVVNDRNAPDGIDIILYEKGTPRPSGAALIVESPSRRGIALERRLAATPQMFERAAAARANDVCEPLIDTDSVL